MDFINSSRTNPLNKIIGLSVVLSMGFLLVVLAGIYGNWFPIIIGLIFALAHGPSAIASTITSSSDYDFNFDPSTSSTSNIVKESGQFLSAFLLTSGFALPLLLHHSRILTKTAVILTVIGGSLIYGTIYTFNKYLSEADESQDIPDLGGGVI